MDAIVRARYRTEADRTGDLPLIRFITPRPKETHFTALGVSCVNRKHGVGVRNGL